MLPCADFPAVNKFLQISLVVQSSNSTDDSEVGPKIQRGKNGERGYLVVAENQNYASSSGSSSKQIESLDELYQRCQEDDDSAAEDITEYRQHSFPEAKYAPFYVRLRIGLDTRDARPSISPSGLSSDDPRSNNNSSSTTINSQRPVNPHKMVSLVGLDGVVPFLLLPRDEEGNLPFTIQSKLGGGPNVSKSNQTMQDYVRRALANSTAIVVDDRDHSGAFWNILGELLLACVSECAPAKGIVKVFAMATPSVAMVGGHSMSKLYDLSKLPPDDDEAAAPPDEQPPTVRPQRGQLPQDPSLQYNPAQDEYNLAGVSGVDLLVPPELDPEEPPENESLDETVARKRESIVSLLYLWIKSHHQAIQEEGSVHVVFIVQRIPDSEVPDQTRLTVVTGMFDESRSKLVKEDEKKHKPTSGCFSVWSKHLKEGEHHSQRLVGGAASVSNLVREVMRILSKGGSAKREFQSSAMRELVRSHVVTRLLKGSVLGAESRVSWMSCIRRGPQLEAGHFDEPYSNESAEVRSFAVAPAAYMVHLRVMETLTILNKYRLRRAPPVSMRGNGGPSRLSSSPSAANFQPRAVVPRRVIGQDQRSVQAKRFVFMKRKLEDLEMRLRAKLWQVEKSSRVKIEREKTAFRLKEYARQRKEEIVRKKREIKEQMVAMREEKKRRAIIQRKRQYTPPGKRSANWNASPPAPIVGRRRPKTPPPVPKRIIRRPPPAPVPKSNKPQGDQGADSPRKPWAEPKLPGAAAQNNKPLAPSRPQNKAPPQSNPRANRAVAPTAEIKKIEMNEFMQRTMVEQEWSRGVKKCICDAHDEDDDTVERLLAIQKGNAPLARVSSVAALPPRKRSAGGSSSAGRQRSGGARRTSDTSVGGSIASRRTPDASKPKPQQAQVAPAREPSITPVSSRASSAASSRRSQSPVTSPNVPRAATPPTPIESTSSRASSAHSSPSRKSSRRSSLNEEDVGTTAQGDAKKVSTDDPHSGGPMEPIPVESAFVTQSRGQESEEEYYRGNSGRATTKGDGGTIRALNGSTTVTRTVRTNSNISRLTPPSDRQAGRATSVSSTPIDDAVEEEEVVEEIVGADTQKNVLTQKVSNQQEAAPPDSDDERSKGSSISSSRSHRSRAHSSAEENPTGQAPEKDPEENEPPAQAGASSSGGRQRFKSADFSDLAAFDYGDGADQSGQTNPVAADPLLNEGGGGASAPIESSRRRSSIGHLMDEGSDEDDLLLDL